MSTPKSPQAGLDVVTADPFEGTSYRLVRPLARGGMGQVYLVEHRELGRECVAKVIHKKLAKKDQLLDRVRIEAESLGALRHPNIVSVNNFGIMNDGRPFIVMEYLRGQDLGRLLQSGRTFTLLESIELTLQTCAALGAAHGVGIVHRDIKPDNLFLHEESDGTPTLKVVDFGLARVLPGSSPDAPSPLAQPTSTGVIVGSMRYVSPEGVSGKGVDCRADIYSLGLVLYRLLAGRGPFGDELNATGQIVARLTEDPPAPSAFASIPIPPELDDALIKALRKSPDERYQSVKELADDLVRIKQLVLGKYAGARAMRPIDRYTQTCHRRRCTSCDAAVLTSNRRRAKVAKLVALSVLAFVVTILAAMGVALLRRKVWVP